MSQLPRPGDRVISVGRSIWGDRVVGVLGRATTGLMGAARIPLLRTATDFIKLRANTSQRMASSYEIVVNELNLSFLTTPEGLAAEMRRNSRITGPVPMARRNDQDLGEQTV